VIILAHIHPIANERYTNAADLPPVQSFAHNLQRGQVMGDTFSNISHSTIVNRSLVQGAINAVQQGDRADSAESLRKLAEVVQQSGNSEAGEYLDSFNEELAKPEPRKGILRRMWGGIQEVLPSVPKMLEIAEGIEKLVQ
jgi:hypothetical protein